jgi:L-ascorbate metabolism protein UlaG (beta-lactamase superfamily)
MKQALRDGVELHLLYEDASSFGTLISGELELRLKRHFRPLTELLQSHPREALEQAPALLAQWLHDEPGGFYSARGRVRRDLARPDPRAARPAALRVEVPGAPSRDVALPSALVPELAARLGEWQHSAAKPARGPARELWAALSAAGAYRPRRPASALQGPVTFVGHATVLLTCGGAQILVDPFLLPREDHHPGGYQPLTHGDFAPEAILITHSHRDHFHPSSLLRLGRDTPIFVPDAPFESALSVDMVHRLRELGFTQARPLRWHEEARVGGCRIVALPFYGEQPTTERVLSPEVRNRGNCWLVEGECEGEIRRYGFIADAGRDHLGDVREMATAALERYGPLDVLFGGFRSWTTYPIQYAASSVPQHLLFTPQALWGARQQIMNDPDALLDTAERWRARHVVPYAAGGAPWYWRLDLGAPADGPAQAKERHFDPRPEAVLRAAAARSAAGAGPLPSPVRVLLMRPGESLTFDGRGAAVVVPNSGHLWPYREPEAVSTAPGALAEPVGLSRKRVLLRLLADAELKRRGQVISTELIQAMSDDLRREHGLVDHDAMLAWLETAGLGMAEYCEILAEWQGVIRLEELMADEIERRLAGQRAFATMRHTRRA